MNISEIILLMIYGFTGAFVTYGCITNDPKWRVQSLFSVESRWGQLAMGVVILAFVIIRVNQWLDSTGPLIIWSF